MKNKINWIIVMLIGFCPLAHSNTYTYHYDLAEKKLATVQSNKDRQQLSITMATSYAIHEKINDCISIIKGYEKANNYPFIEQMARNIMTQLSNNNKLSESKVILSKIENPRIKNIFNEYKAYTLIQRKELSKAKTTAQSINNVRTKDRILTSIGKNYILQNKLEEANAILTLIQTPKEQDKLQKDIIIHHIKKKELEKAFVLMDQSKNPKQMSQILIKTLDQYKIELNKKHLDLTLDWVSSPRSIFIIKHKLALYYMKNGEETKAYNTIYQILDNDIQSKAKQNIIKILIQRNRLSEAESLIEQIQKSKNRDNTVIALSIGLALNKNPEKSIKVLNRLNQNELRETALIQIGTALGKSNDYHYAQLLINQISPQIIQDKMRKAYLISASTHMKTEKLLRSIQTISNASIKNDCLAKILLHTTHTPDTIQILLSHLTHPRTKAHTLLKLIQKESHLKKELENDIQTILPQLFPKSFQSKYILSLINIKSITWPKHIQNQFGSILKNNYARTDTTLDNTYEKEKAILYTFKTNQINKGIQILKKTPLNFQIKTLFKIPPLSIRHPHQAEKYKRDLKNLR